MMKRLARTLLVSSAVAASSPAGLAWADGPASPPSSTATATANESEGREHFQRGVGYSKDGDWRAALIEFRRAYELAPNYRVLFNIGQVAFDLQDYAQALDAFERYLAEGGDAIPAERRAHVEGEIKRLTSRVASVTIQVNVPSATILVDDVVVATSPLDHALRVGAGRHKISATATDRIPVQRVIDIAGGESKTIALELRAPAVAPGVEPPVVVVPPPDETPRSHTGLWIGIGVTGALAIGTAVMGIVTLSNDSAFEDEKNRFVPTGNRDAIESARSSAETTALVFDILAGATIVAGVTTLVIGLTSGDKKSGSATTLPWLSRGTF